MGKVLRLNKEQLEVMTFLAKRGEVYGLHIMTGLNKERKETGVREIGYGNFYANLRLLAEEGLLDRRWGENTLEGAHCRYYRISEQGRGTLQANCECQAGIIEGGSEAYQGV